MSSEDVSALRSLVYKYASKLVDYPYDEDIEAMPRLLEEFREALSVLGECDNIYKGLDEEASGIERVFARELSKLGRDYFQAEYVSTFELGVKGPKCPLYESEYVEATPEEIAKVFIETGKGFVNALGDLKSKLGVISSVSEFYSRYDVKAKDLIPDHIVAELEFMHYLAALECKATGKDREEYLRSEAEFLEKHILRWIDKLLECIREKSSLETYKLIFSVVSSFVKRDYEYIKSVLE